MNNTLLLVIIILILLIIALYSNYCKTHENFESSYVKNFANISNPVNENNKEYKNNSSINDSKKAFSIKTK